MFVAMAQKLSQDLTAHPLSNLTVAVARINTQLAFEYVAAMGDDAFVIAMLDRIHVPSSAEEGTAVIKEFLS